MSIIQLDARYSNIYRTLRLESLEQCPECFASSVDEEKSLNLEAFQNHLFRDDLATFGAFDHEKLVGMTTLAMNEQQKLKHKATLLAVYVTPDYRGKGYGARLLESAIDLAREKAAIEQIHVTLATNNETALNIYHRLGFEQYGKMSRSMKLGPDVYCDELQLVLHL
ncbi:GNAT family N-acetyltransferase [Geomicrobium sp. JCM 19039]|uniref:GNAT family N-acetyltransferase n=1 Tax=Geomicrobium sp. JCM 19039 TaxID=1460636 RepID=UPI00045F18B2|nr:GNAT family N-acetyltransferase [Geomicrobium sp. JCM 19039]GAK10521.1 acetyltransferase, GNAT family [Geomicrobium sp. JCM 19039]